jgi:hypothetical protein
MQGPLSILAGALLLAVANAPTVAAQQSLAEQVFEACGNELETYCAGVTPGEGRLLACLYEHGDKLSGQCEFALYDAAVRACSPTSPANAAPTSRACAPACRWARVGSLSAWSKTRANSATPAIARSRTSG